MNRISQDTFNSEVFGVKMGNVEVESIEAVDVLLKQAKLENYNHLSIKLDCGEYKICNELFKKGFLLTDTLVTYEFDYDRCEVPSYKYSNDVHIHPIEKEDIITVCQIAHSSFFNDRFHNDPSLPNVLCDVYYEKWIENSCNGFADLVLVAKDSEGHILAFGTGKYKDEKESTLVLNAVTMYARGKGVYTAMIFEAMKYYEGKSKRLKLGTQINNFAVQKAWNKLGFKISNSMYVLHKKVD